jgi:predicted RNA-binding Zn ribbon-like protein
MVTSYQLNSKAGYDVSVPSQRPTAPAGLDLIEQFVNDMRAQTPDALAAWFARFEPTNAPLRVDDADLANAVSLRETFRTLLAGNNGVPVGDAATTAINDALKRCLVEVAVRPKQGLALEYRCSAEGVDQILGSYLCAMLAAIADNSWSRMKACANPDCRWAFFDRSRNHAGTWCEMATCGSVFKMRRHRERQRIRRNASKGESPLQTD